MESKKIDSLKIVREIRDAQSAATLEEIAENAKAGMKNNPKWQDFLKKVGKKTAVAH